MDLSWIGRNRTLEVSPRVRLVDEADAEALRQKREALSWRPRNGFLKDESPAMDGFDEREDRAA